ncbi:MAG TPA: DUF4245 domain-containing protein [Nocardioidaceae bacterium]|nr:DUF4245 domain-containing protein [Nocardioidaceae bacterium]
MSEQPGRYQRSAAGMIGAMLILLAVVVGFVLFRDAIREDPQSPVKTVDYHRTLGFAREQATFDVLAPERLPDGWRATSVEFIPEPFRWHLGVLTDGGEYVGLEQAHGSERSMVSTYVDREAAAGADVVIDGRHWSSWSDQGGDRALVRANAGVVTLVVGSVPQDVLVDYVESLR